MRFAIDIFAWIPHPDVPNPLHGLPGGTGLYGPGASGPRFGGDNFVTPPVSPTGFASLTYRAKQQLVLDTSSWGLVRYRHGGVVPGVTTVLTGTRAAGGKVCHSMTATVLKSKASVKFDASEDWYVVEMNGKVMDPYPTHAGRTAGGRVGSGVGGVAGSGGRRLGGAAGSGVGGGVATAATPALEWDMTLRIQHGGSIGLIRRAAYSLDCPLATLDSGGPTRTSSLGAGRSNLMHGTIEVRRYPSYIVYVTAGSSTAVLFFADANHRNLLEIAVGTDSRLRDVHW
ncbi:MAG: hypothetical protein KDA88_02515 [Planctomycetaceae bacterium]|nr:hypothetical protein [Planctomycetaceae bacterium]